MKRKFLHILLYGLALTFAPGMLAILSAPAQAALSCTFSITNVNFGTIDLTTNTIIDATASLSANCSGGLPLVSVRICPNINAGSGGVASSGDPRHALNGATALNYNLFQDSARTTVWGSYLWSSSPTPPTIDLALNGSGSGSLTATIYARIYATQQTLAPGTYTSIFSGTQTQIAYAQSGVLTCALIGSTNATSASFTVMATYSSVCHLASTNLNFGSAGVLTASVTATSTVTATCSSTTPYTVGLSGGNVNATDPTQRKMANGSAQLTYGLYQDSAHNVPWGNTTSNWEGGTGSGLSQSLTVHGLVPVQTTPAPGTYTDTIVATVTY
jgi:spore coat protein U-like protein